jgi:endo-1,3(4)-beta-glucanase
MIPVNPGSALIRTPRFVQEEWDTFFRAGGPLAAQNINDGWKGIIYANLAIVDSKASWNFFSDPGFSTSWLDGGASRSWYLAYAAGRFRTPSSRQAILT